MDTKPSGLVHEGGGVHVLGEINGARVDGRHGGQGEEVRRETSDERRLLKRRGGLGKGGVDNHQLVQVLLELRVVGVDHLGEDCRRGLVGLVNDVHVELGGVEADGAVELLARVVVEVHGDVHRQGEEPDPQLRLPGVHELGACLKAGSEEVAMAVLVLAPVLEVLEDGVELVVGVLLEVTVDGDVAPVPDLLAEVGGVDDELGLEESVLAVLGQEAKIQGESKVAHSLVEEPGMPGFVSAHEGEDLGNHRSGLLETAAKFLVQQKAGELGGARALKELDEDAARLTRDAVSSSLERVVAHEVLLVEVLTELLQDRHQLRLVEVGVDLGGEELLHLVEVGGVEARGEQVLVRRLLDSLAHLLDSGVGVDATGGGARDAGKAHRPLRPAGDDGIAEGGGFVHASRAELGGLRGGTGGDRRGGAHGGSHR
mmetsp:Transcript_8975/g.14259  ORF Transcript_8975/g.14259 Transcript_8975/m.14259 type:complete len:428 (-) Transcript_8975:77-1360(-)